MDKSSEPRQISPMTKTQLASARRLADRLAPSGFTAAFRGGMIWLGYPDGCDTEVLSGDQLGHHADVDALAATLEVIARRRGVALAVIRNACDLCGWEVDVSADGLWGLSKNGGSQFVSVGWTLTKVLRDGEPRYVLKTYLDRTGANFIDGSSLDRAFSMDLTPPSSRSPATQCKWDPVHVESLPDFVTHVGNDDASMDSWCNRQLLRKRDQLKKPYANYARELGPLKYRGEGDWISREELAECARASWQVSPYPGHALNLLLSLGYEEHRTAALEAWDRWIHQSGADGDVLGFDELAALLYAERQDARKSIETVDNFHVALAVRASQFNALHIARFAFHADLGAFRVCASDTDRWNAFYDLAANPVREGAFLLPLFLDQEEVEELHALTLAMLRHPPEEGAWRFVDCTLSLAAALDWKDVADCFVAIPQWRNAILGEGSGPFYAGSVQTGCLAISILSPKMAKEAIVRPAFRQSTDEARSGSYDDESFAIAIAWWRCRAAQRKGSTINKVEP